MKSVAEARVFPAIVHLVRNAVDHGIGGARGPSRRRRGSSRAGRAPNHLLGDREPPPRSSSSRTTAPASIARPSPPAPEPVPGDRRRAPRASRARPGLSTAPSVTTTSGRGMGMDIVERVVVHQLGGQLELSTTPGQGTQFRLQIPLTVADRRRLRDRARRGRRFAAARRGHRGSSRSTRRPPRERARPRQGQSLGLVERRGETMPLTDLAIALGLDRDGPPPTKAVVVRKASEARRLPRRSRRGPARGGGAPARRPARPRPRGCPPPPISLGDGKPTLLLDRPSLARPLGSRGPRALAGTGLAAAPPASALRELGMSIASHVVVQGRRRSKYLVAASGVLHIGRTKVRPPSRGRCLTSPGSSRSAAG